MFKKIENSVAAKLCIGMRIVAYWDAYCGYVIIYIMTGRRSELRSIQRLCVYHIHRTDVE